MDTTTERRAASRRGLLFIVLTALLWGTVGVAGRAVNELAATNALSIGFFRLAFAVPVLLVACRVLLGRDFWRLSRADLGLTLLLGAAMALYQMTYFGAVLLVGVTIAVLIALCTAPVIVALLSSLLLRERLTVWVLLALVCAILGTILLVQARSVDPQSPLDQTVNPLGIALALGAAFSYAMVTLCSRVLAGRCHPLPTLAIGAATGALMILPVATLAGGLALSYEPPVWGLLVYMGVFPTALAYLLFLNGLRFTTATVASIATLLEPLTGAMLAWAIFDERLGWNGLRGAALLLAALLILLWRPAGGPQRSS